MYKISTIRASKDHLIHISESNYSLRTHGYIFQSKVKMKFLALVSETIFSIGW